VAPGRRTDLRRDDLSISARDPIVAPGERLSTEVVDYLEQTVAMGGMVQGAGDEALETFRVVA
jgi:hypothetical protein